MRIRLIVEYDGTAYAGWQRQDNHITVQQALEEALLQITGSSIRIVGASRTDSGVHALGQTAHFDYTGAIPPAKFAYALNARLPRDIRVRDSAPVADTFHARFSALGKRYRYRIDNNAHAGALTRHFCWHQHRSLSDSMMMDAAALLLGEHDFQAFMSVGGQSAVTIRTLHHLSVTRQHGFVDVLVEGDGFLYHMVRIIVGTLVYVGCGMLPPTITRMMLDTGDRSLGGPTAPPHGLLLEKVFYPVATDEDTLRREGAVVVTDPKNGGENETKQ